MALKAKYKSIFLETFPEEIDSYFYPQTFKKLRVPINEYVRTCWRASSKLYTIVQPQYVKSENIRFTEEAHRFVDVELDPSSNMKSGSVFGHKELKHVSSPTYEVLIPDVCGGSAAIDVRFIKKSVEKFTTILYEIGVDMATSLDASVERVLKSYDLTSINANRENLVFFVHTEPSVSFNYEEPYCDFVFYSTLGIGLVV